MEVTVADNQLWLLWVNEGYHYEWMNDYMAHICMIIIWITILQCVITDILTAISVYVWQSEHAREYVLHTKLFISLFLLFKLLLYVLVVK